MCYSQPQNASASLSQSEMSNEYLPDYDANNCLIKDSLWPTEGCDEFERALQYSLSDWENDKDSTLVRVNEYGYFATIHSTFNQIIEAALKRNKVHFPRLNGWYTEEKLAKDSFKYHLRKRYPQFQPKGSFDTWFQPFPYNTRLAPQNDFHEITNMCEGVNDRKDINGFSRFVAMSQLMATFLQPKSFITKKVGIRKRKLQWKEHDRVIGLYIRRGDACEEREVKRTKRTCDDLFYYMEDVKRVAKKYSINKIYVLSDGGNTIYNQTDAFPEYEWMFEPAPPSLEESQRIELRLGKGINGTTEANELLVDFFTLTSADVLIGKATSNVFRGALEYKSGLLKSRAPYVSLDAPWCFCFGCKSRVDRGPFAGEMFDC